MTPGPPSRFDARDADARDVRARDVYAPDVYARHPHARHRPARQGYAARGFTLIEALAALLLIAIVLPVVMRGVSIAARAGAAARRHTEAASLAQSKLSEIVATESWRAGSLTGRFDATDGEGAFDYGWAAETQQWNEPYVQQLAVHVTWIASGVERRVTLTTLVYEGRPPPPETEDAAPAAGGGAT